MHKTSHLCPGDTGNVPSAGRRSCAPSEEKGSREKEAAGCDRPCPGDNHQPHRPPGGSGRPVGAPPPASGSSDVPDPRRPAQTQAEVGTGGQRYRDGQMSSKNVQTVIQTHS